MSLQSSEQEQNKPYDQDCSVAPLSKAFGSYFLGTHAENSELFLSFITKTVKIHQTARLEHNKNELSYISENHKRSPEFAQAQKILSEKFTELAEGLKKYSTPFHTVRYQGNLIGDSTIPSLLGYISGLLYNQNNVSYDGSPFTTMVEVEVSKKLIQMLGFPEYQTIESEETVDLTQIRSWAHLTVDGTVANIEALWSARNVKFYPLAVRKALDQDKFFSEIQQDIYVKVAKDNLKKRIIECSAWELLNISCDEALCLTRRIYDKIKNSSSVKITLEEVYARIQHHSLQENGMIATYEYIRSLEENCENPIKSPVCFGPATLHYSLPKAMSLLGLGKGSFRTIKVDLDTKQDLSYLTLQLLDCIKSRIPLLAVVLVLGTTCEGAVDPIAEVLKLRKTFRKEFGFDFFIHIDAAYGGYFACVTKPFSEEARFPSSLYSPPISLNKYATKQYSVVGKADSLTIDPHKSGFIPFACGAFIQRNHLLKRFLTFKATYITDSPIGMYGIEGSKSGAPACAAWLSHECIPLDRFGHGAILSSCLYNAKRLYAQLLDSNDLPFKITCLARLPEEKTVQPNMDRVTEQRDKIVNEIAKKSHEELSKRLSTDQEFVEFFNEIGPDLNIVTFQLNFKDPATNQWNQSLKCANAFNHSIYLKMKPFWDGVGLKEASTTSLLLNESRITRNEHGEHYFNDICERMGCDIIEEEDVILVLRSTNMHPFFAETSSPAFIIDGLKQYAFEILASMKSENLTMSTLL